ncbi:LysR family transcriptional regulator [Erwinia pyri]|uniref:LysR family transcriptional regulator n=1 Tax=Erwinia pyri TaxID=3062598 RepID=A0AA50DMC8_9GAMM|nr:LysR family transcriptional regulator [Erwinia sp. DE2]WLS80382.1 LysR family transcriptional regulator [Erwinia sp. DE2]
MLRIEDVRMFVRTTQLGSFSSVARESGIMPAQVSAAILRLEKTLGVRLFVRTTRSLRMTREGATYLPYAHEMLEVIRAGSESLENQTGELKDELRISMPSDVGRSTLLPLITAFCKKHPGVAVNLMFTDTVSDVHQHPVDIAVRYGILPDKSYVALPLAEYNKRILVASPAYLEHHGAPHSLEEIADRDCILFTLNGHPYASWSFYNNQQKHTLSVKSRFVCNDSETSRRLALEGVGIAYKSWLDVHQDIAENRLVPVLPHLTGVKNPLSFISPHRSQITPTARALYAEFKSHFDRLSVQFPFTD